jgi:hypothetical protein
MISQGMMGAIDPQVWSTAWNVNSQAVGHNREGVLKYLATYVFKTAITDSRIEAVGKGKVTFRYHKKNSHRPRRMTLAAHEFMRRYLLHALPPGFMRIRYCGFMSAGSKIPHSRLVALVEMAQAFEVERIQHQHQPRTPLKCTVCGGPLSFRACHLARVATPTHLPKPAFHKLE